MKTSLSLVDIQETIDDILSYIGDYEFEEAADKIVKLSTQDKKACLDSIMDVRKETDSIKYCANMFVAEHLLTLSIWKESNE